MDNSLHNQSSKSEVEQKIAHSNQTTSWKIRELAKAGFLRTEIRDILEVRYQRVRKVLVDAGIKSGMSRRVEQTAQHSNDLQDAKEHRPKFDWNRLLDNGFVLVGEWSIDGQGIFLSGELPSVPGVYSFILDNEVAYVGLTQSALKTRMGHYRIGHRRQKTSARVKELIKRALSDGKRVRVLMCTPENTEWKGLPVHTAPGLEAGLISLIKPMWNIQGK